MSLIESILGPNGDLSRLLPDYAYRPEQIEVAKQIAASFENERICLAEAGTGVGKTMAYLVPALEQICEGKRVVVTTHTLNLQGQLVQKDIPLLQRAAGDPSFRAVLVKGMGNYLCKYNLEYESTLPLLGHEEPLQRIRAWAETTKTGDVAELPFSARGWSEVNCDRDTCHRQECHYYDECFYFNMRREAEKAQLIVANHALFFSDLVIRMAEPGAGILPPYDFVIFDEAHHVEEVASRVFGVEFSNYRIPSFLNRLKKLRSAGLDANRLETLDFLNSDLFQFFSGVRRKEFFFSDVFDQSGMTSINSTASQLLVVLKELNSELDGRARDIREDDEMSADRLEGYARTGARIAGDLQALLFEESKDWFVWGERLGPASRVVQTMLHRTPVRVSDILSEQFWKQLKGSALVSATLSNSGGFSYARSRLGIADADEVVVGSPFDFKEQSLLYVPAHMPFPSSEPGYVQELTAEIARILCYSEGRAFVLFTSYRMLEAVHSALAPELDFPLLRQGEMPNQSLLQEFRKLPNCCLFGTSSFWEGVDVQGEALSCVIIDKLPFSVPDSPVSRARIAAIEEDGGNAFAELSVPEAQIRLKQGFGRLIRTQSDRGVVAIFDSRLWKKSYGRAFFDILPPARVTRSLDEVRRFFEARAALVDE
ncbi:MAG TPA: helicase C-terminal domain-containing protein [Armatimonadota bacterium]|nr:helicase C-terminal domain-containing protein [Armatimonadota bacterium]